MPHGDEDRPRWLRRCPELSLKRLKALSHVPLTVQYSLAVALEYHQKKKSGENIKRREERGSKVDIRCYRAHTGNVMSELPTR